MDEYLDKSGKAMLAVGMTFDYARAAEKMTDWHCVGQDNKAWNEGPFISSPENEKEIDHSFPYCSKTSNEFAKIAGIVLGSNPPESANGGIKIPMPPKDKHESRVEPIISKLAIVEQFELFKEFLILFDGPYNKKRCKAWEEKIDSEAIDLLTELTNRRNELTHDNEYKLPSMDEAVMYFYQLRELAKLLFTSSLENENS